MHSVAGNHILEAVCASQRRHEPEAPERERETHVKHTQRFTLIELLTTITIILVIMGLIFPVYFQVKKRANKARAQSQISELEMAIKQYHTTYQILPFTITNTSDVLINTDVTNGYSDLMACLGGIDNNLNPRNLQFLNLDDTNSFRDPWGHEYRVSLDLDYDNQVDSAKIYGHNANLTRIIVVWSAGPDGFDAATDTAYNDDNVTAWE